MFSTSRRKWLWTTVATTIIALGTQWAHAQGNQPPFKLGMLLGFTGPAAQGAANYLAATRLAVKELNDAGGLLGRRIEIVQADHGLDPARAVSEARRLVQLEKVNVVLGPEASGLAVAVAPIFNEAKTLYFSTTVTAAPTPFNFTSLMSGLTQATAMMDFAANHLKAKSIAILSDNGSVGKVLQDDVKRMAPGKGLQLVMVQEHDIRANDLTPQLLALRRANPDVILHSGSLPADGGALVKALAELGWSPKIISTIFGQSTVQVMAVSGPDSFKSGNYWGLLPKAFTYCSKDRIGDRAYDKYLAKLKAFDPAAYEKIDHKVSLYIYDPIFVYAAAVAATKSLDAQTNLTWIEQNGSKLRGAGAGYPLSPTATSHFMQGPDSVTFVQRPDVLRNEDKLIERQIDC